MAFNTCPTAVYAPTGCCWVPRIARHNQLAQHLSLREDQWVGHTDATANIAATPVSPQRSSCKCHSVSSRLFIQATKQQGTVWC